MLVAGAALGAAPGLAAADTTDLVLARLATRTVDPATGAVTGVTPDNTAFRSLASELGVVLAPHLLTPADTIGSSSRSTRRPPRSTPRRRTGARSRARAIRRA